MSFFKSVWLGCLLFFPVCTFAQSEQENLGEGVNSFVNESNPVLSPDGSVLYFTRQNHPDNTGGQKDAGDIWFSEKQADGAWSPAKNIGKPLNNRYANSIVGFADNGQTVFLHGHYLKSESKPNTQGISVARKEGSGWSDPQPVNIPYYYSKSNHLSGSLHTSGNIMVVSLQSYDTRGAEDLYVLFKRSDGSWSEPRNLGKDINTPYQEMTPFLSPDGKTLFFASNGYEGFGSRDIFMSVRLDESWKKWSNPKNLGPGVNTEGIELYYNLPPEGEFAYLTSTQNSDGLGDINRVRIRPENLEVRQEVDTFKVIEAPAPEAAAPAEAKKVAVKGRVINKTTQAPVQAQLTWQSLQQDTVAAADSVQTSGQGAFSLMLDPEKDYALTVSADGYIKARDKIIFSGGDNEPMQKQILLTPIEVGATVNLPDVLFDRGTARMLPGSAENLDEVVDFLRENPGVAIEVGGHTDNQGRADLNLQLSQQRARAVKEYLTGQGISDERVIDKGYGGTQPVASNAIEEERSKNRRVEFTIISK